MTAPPEHECEHGGWKTRLTLSASCLGCPWHTSGRQATVVSNTRDHVRETGHVVEQVRRQYQLSGPPRWYLRAPRADAAQVTAPTLVSGRADD